jgi:hypothetical protein
MDQLRTALVWLKRHHFWVLCGLVAIIAVGSWAKASGKMDTLFGGNSSAITGSFVKVQNLRKEPFHPNEDVNTKQQAQTAQQRKDVAKLWEQLYNRQREHVLEWPVPPLTKEFGDFVDKLQFGAEIRSDLRSNYQNYIEGHFPTLPKQIDARAIEPGTPAGGPGAEFRGGGAEAGAQNLQDENDYICVWSPADQAFIQEDLNFRQQPSSLKIWVTQENLWVYHTLLDVIAKTNRAANATRMSNAAIQEVGELSLGLRAAKGSRTSGRLMVKIAAPTAAGPGPEGGPGQGPAPGPAPGPEGGGPRVEFSPGGGPNGAQMTDEQEKVYLLSGRYISADGKPIPFGAGAAPAPGEAQAAPVADPAAAAQPLDLTVFGQEYKRLPVRMALRMDQRWLPRLIAECASQPLQVEVQEVRVNPPEGIGSAAGGGGPGSGYRPGSEGGPGGGSVFPDDPPQQAFPTQPEMVNVIIQGTILIFNKPNAAILQPPGGQPPANTAAATP